MEFTKDDFTISNDKKKLNFTMIHRFLENSYWAKGVSYDIVRKSIKNSIAFGLYYKDKQIGFARVNTDKTTFAHLADVFVLEEYRGKGLAKWLMECVFAHPDLQNLRSWILATRDAHGLYEKFGFKLIDDPNKFMIMKNPDHKINW